MIAVEFWMKVKEAENGCWNWIGATNRKGYGICRRNGKDQMAHRVSWEMSYGAIPESKIICHRCDNTCCVRPAHLFIGTQKDNIDDCRSKGRHRGHKNPTVAATIDGSIPRAIRDARAAKGFTQYDLDTAAGFALGTTAQYECGARVPTLHSAKCLAKALGMDAAVLVELA